MAVALAMTPLPYTDKKPVGAADFYFAINATFRFLLEKFGRAVLQNYWTDLGREYFAPVTARWQREGLAGIARYWAAFFGAEPGAVVAVQLQPQTVVVEVKQCPAILALRQAQREIVPCFCQHCYFMEEAMAQPAGFTVRIEGGNGRCSHTFHPRTANPPPQDLGRIAEARC